MHDEVRQFPVILYDNISVRTRERQRGSEVDVQARMFPSNTHGLVDFRMYIDCDTSVYST